MFDVDKTIGILSNKEASAKSLMKDIKTAYLELPDFLKPGAEKWDQTVIGFDNGSTIMGGTTAEDSFRGESLSLLALDEFAHVPQEIAENFFTSVFPTISTGGRMIMVSTPNGSTGKFYEIFTNAGRIVNGIQNPFVAKKVTWERHPDRDTNWRDTTLSILGKIRFNQEHACSFTGSTNTLISGETLQKLSEHVSDPAYITEDGLQIWKPPQKGRLYAFGVDVSKGAGNSTDYSTINIYDVTDFTKTQMYEQVGLFRKNDIVLFDFIDIVFKLTPMFNNPMVVVENNTTGEVVCKVLYHDKEYENIFFDYERAEHGINANVRTKPMALNFFKDDVESGKMRIRSRDMLTELTYFEEVTPGVFKARVGRNLHDDTISSAYWISYALRSRYYQDDFMYYAGKASNTTGTTNSNKEDEEILQNFNKYVRPMSDRDIFKKQLGRL
jgi:hypothetical protein